MQFFYAGSGFQVKRPQSLVLGSIEARIVAAGNPLGRHVLASHADERRRRSYGPPPKVRTVAKFPEPQKVGSLRPIPGAIHRALFQAQYNLEMADRVACSCVACPRCGIWVVVSQRTEGGENKKKFRESCPAPECGKEFEFETGEPRVFEVPLPLFERRHFYRSELI